VSDLLLGLYHRLPPSARSAVATLRGYYLRRWRFGADSERRIVDVLRRERWTAEQWRVWREARLGALLERAATQVPYYRDAWQARRRAGDRSSWELLENWPILEKEAVRQQPRAFLMPDSGPTFEEPTSGTSGTPLTIHKSREALRELYALATARNRRWYGVAPTDRTARLGGQLVTPLAQRRPPFWVWNAAGQELYMSTFHLGPDMIPAYLDALRQYHIRCLTGYASSLYALAQGVLRAGRRDLGMTVAVTSGEPLGEREREIIGAAFDCPVRETYGMTENVAAASECEAGRLHAWPEAGVIETRDDEFICTGLLNDAMPLIRYRIGDRGRLAPQDQPCPCGRTLPVIAGLEGRTSDLLVTADGRRVFWLNPVFYGLPVHQSQIVQETPRRIRARFVPAREFAEGTAQTIVSRLRNRLGDLEIVLEPVSELPRSRTGKVRHVIREDA
jgi:phenylacetate-coenzyme A ligase PaaK-like adenylate-forming protein